MKATQALGSHISTLLFQQHINILDKAEHQSRLELSNDNQPLPKAIVGIPLTSSFWMNHKELFLLTEIDAIVLTEIGVFLLTEIGVFAKKNLKGYRRVLQKQAMQSPVFSLLQQNVRVDAFGFTNWS